MTILVTGCAGFIGSNLVDKLLKEKYTVLGVDNLNDYYSPKIKSNNLKEALKNRRFTFLKGSILDHNFVTNLFTKNKIDIVIHLAARAGVRPSIFNPLIYAEENKLGTLVLLDAAVKNKIKNFIFASSSSVYGNTAQIPFVENDACLTIVSPYGASKRSAEYFIETAYKNFGLKSTILRLFTVYGPRGRPDMAPYIFTKAVLDGKPIIQFGSGTSRDYTYIDDIIDGILKTIKVGLSFETINLGGDMPVGISDFIKSVERASGKKARVEIQEKRTGDVDRTWADVSQAKRLLDWSPKVPLDEGLRRFVAWFNP